MKILLFSTPQPAHLDWGGFLPTAQLLAEKGHEILWASGEGIAPVINLAGTPFAPLRHTGWRDATTLPPIDPSLEATEMRRARQRRAFDTWLDVEEVTLAVEALEPVVRDFAPECIVSEMFSVAAAFVAERAGIPLVVAGWPAIDNPRSEDPLSLELMERLQELNRRFGCTGRNLSSTMPAMQSPDLHITWWSERWFAGIPILPQTRHAGGIAPPATPLAPSLPDPDDLPWVLITLGTTFNHDPAFFRMAAQAAVNMGCLPLLVHGDLSDGVRTALGGNLPAQSHMIERVDFSAVLPHVAAAIHHGGAGTTHALVIQGVPQMVVPHAGDQGVQARAVARCGIGDHCPARELTVERAQRTLAALLPDRSSFRLNALNLKREFAALGGIATSAALIESIG